MESELSESKSVRLTDAYSHSLVHEHWAGLPFDLVFAYYDEDKRPEHVPLQESDGFEEQGAVRFSLESNLSRDLGGYLADAVSPGPIP